MRNCTYHNANARRGRRLPLPWAMKYSVEPKELAAFRTPIKALQGPQSKASFENPMINLVEQRLPLVHRNEGQLELKHRNIGERVHRPFEHPHLVSLGIHLQPRLSAAGIELMEHRI